MGEKHFFVVTKYKPSQLFSEKNLERLAELECRFVYTVEAIIKGTPLSETTTQFVAISPDVAVEMCKRVKGDFIEVWAISKDEFSVFSEKWEPEYFEKEFRNQVPLFRDDEESEEDAEEENNEDNEDSDDDEGVSFSELMNNGDYMVIPPDRAILLKSIESIAKMGEAVISAIVGTSFGLGHPIDFEGRCDDIANACAGIICDLIHSKGGMKSKFKKVNGIRVPYWTKKQIENAKIDPEDLE